MKKLDKEELSYRVGELLSLPRVRRSGKAYRIVKAFCEVLTEALLRGETIKVDGFGTFKTHTRPTVRHSTFHPFSGKVPKFAQVVETFPPTPRIVFKPSKALLRTINHV